MRKTLLTALVTLTLTVGAEHVQAQSGHDLFQQALVMERANGELRDAIALYERIVEEFADERELVAMALVQMGGCYEKLGTEGAREAYGRVVSEFADQAESAETARTRLALLRGQASVTLVSSVVERHIWGGPYAKGPDGGPDASGGPSPDGRHLAYVDWRSGDVALRDLVTGESRRLTNDGDIDQGGYAFAAEFSADGRYVAYARVNTAEQGSAEVSNVELRVIGLDGTPPRVVFSDSTWDRDFAWSWDSKHIATSRESAGGGLDLFTLSVDDGSMTMLMRFDESFSPGICFSPDDRYVVLEVPVGGDLSSRDIWMVAADGNAAAVPLLEHPADDRPVGWVPGTQELLFVSDRSGTRDLWAAEVFGREVRGEPRPVHRDVGDFWPLGLSRDGTLFHAVYTLHHHTYVAPFEIETGEIDLVAAIPVLGNNISPSWSPNGDYLALERIYDVEMPPWRREFLVVSNLQTGEERRFAPEIDVGFVRLPWSPDGRSILFEGMEWKTSERLTLYRADVASGEITTLLELPGIVRWGAFGAGAIWTADGGGIVYAYRGRLALRELASGQETELYQDEKLASRLLALSPDGEWVAFGVGTTELHEEGRSIISDSGRFLMVNIESGEVRELTTANWSGQVGAIEWTPNGEHLVFWVTGGGEGASFFRVHRSGGSAQELWATGEAINLLAVHPRGDRIAYTVRENEMDIWVIENIKEVLKRQN